ncbi:putative lipoprotein [Caulobacter virus Magneto]|uniref:putative lipoprotein n=1 Tax=Caulobacter virus Magneto TaxID=1211642 RepID=UPI00028B442C|nr:putative lipoprotein [Caulobacter virus Magneto]AFU87193.1 putative lipoprotein [Caulobacter virus Magneto]
MRRLAILTLAAITLTACAEQTKVDDQVYATLENGCVVHKIVRQEKGSMFVEEVYTTVCPNGATRTEWETTKMVGKTVTVERHATETPATR